MGFTTRLIILCSLVVNHPNVSTPGKAWKWFHVTFNTYGTWLPGDPRGFRTRHHREHVEGDYRHPPPSGLYSNRFAANVARTKRAPVRLTAAQRRVAGRAILSILHHLGATVVALAVGAEHVHLVVRLPNAEARGFVGRAKKHASHELRRLGIAGGVWAKRSRALPIVDRAHQLNAIRYVKKHRDHGAWVWVWGEPQPDPIIVTNPPR